MPVSAELYKAIMRELDEAEEFLRKRGERKIYASFGGALFIEVTRDEALEIIGRERKRVEELLARLKEAQ